MLYRKLSLLVLFIFVNGALIAQKLPSPKEFFGNEIGTDYTLENFTKAEAYFIKLAESDRVKWVDMGPTEEGRRQPMMIVTSPENHKKLDRYKELSQKLARAELSVEEARAIIGQAKPVVWIDGGLHANETVGTHQLIETYYQLVTRNDDETLRILDDVIILLAHANPDGHELMSNWYMRPKDQKKRDMNIPTLYQKYAGHDNNRDFFMNNLKESTNISRQQYIEWMPQIIYNHHQTSPAGTVVAGPPYRDPFNHALDPMLITGIDGVGAAMINGLFAEGKPGYTRLGGSPYSTWWNGGLRTTPYFHNMIGILTEITGNPTPSAIPFVPNRLLATNNTPFPIQPQPWSFRQSIDYSVSMNYAVLNYARQNANNLLFNIYRMGRNSIEKGNQDTWSPLPNFVEKIEKQYAADRKAGKVKQDPDAGNRRGGVPTSYYEAVFADKNLRDPRGFIIPADQADFPTAIDFVNALIKSGIQIHQATSDFKVGEKSYPKDSYVVKTAQAFRPHVLDMFEPQDHPNDFQYPGGPPIRPYDAAGWTLAFQMGITFDRILDGFDGPFRALPYGELQKPATPTVAEANGFLLDARANNTFMVVNKLLKNGGKAYRLGQMEEGMPSGSFYVGGDHKDILLEALKESGVKPVPTADRDLHTRGIEVKPSRIALFDTYGGSMPSGWVRWIMEKYQFDYEVVYPLDIDKGNLSSKYDVILFISGGIPRNLGSAEDTWNRQPAAEDIPKEFHKMLGLISSDKSLPELRTFMENGGNIVTVGSSTNLAYHLDLPVKNALTEIGRDGNEISLPGEKYYIPGSILISKINTDHPATWGMNGHADVMFNNSNVFKLKPEAGQAGIEPLAWIDRSDPLRSGWAFGQSYLEDGILAFRAPVGRGSLMAYTPEITFRAQAFGTFKMLFNNLLKASDELQTGEIKMSE